MHFDFGQIFSDFVWIWGFVRQIISGAKGGLESVKTVQGIFDDTKSLLEKPSERDKGIEQARIVPELLRSYAIFGFLEYLYRTTTTLLLLLILREARKMFERK